MTQFSNVLFRTQIRYTVSDISYEKKEREKGRQTTHGRLRTRRRYLTFMYFLLKCSAVKLNLEQETRQMNKGNQITLWEDVGSDCGVKGVRFLFTVGIKEVTPGTLKNAVTFGRGQSHGSDCNSGSRQHLFVIVVL